MERGWRITMFSRDAGATRAQATGAGRAISLMRSEPNHSRSSTQFQITCIGCSLRYILMECSLSTATSFETMPNQRETGETFAVIAEELSGTAGVTLGSERRGFGYDALQVDGHIFAMTKGGSLVLKLPGERVAELVARGQGVQFDAGKGRPMKG